MPPEPKISVVVATYNRAQILARTLDCLIGQSVAPSSLEIIVVDDGSLDDTPARVRAAVQRAPMPIIYLAHANRGPGYTQNRGIRAARGDIVLLIADDIFLTPDALSAHLFWHVQHPEPEVAILGRATPAPDLKGTGFLNSWDAFGLGRFERLPELPYLLFWAFNVSFKRDFMLANGMFCEVRGRFGPAAHEDTELGYRLHRRGMRLLYAPDALGHHYHPTTLRQAALRYRERGLNYPDLLARVPDPMLPVTFRVPTLRTLAAYRRAVGICPWLMGRERRFSWHMFRHVLRTLTFNRLTIPLFWTPVLSFCEHRRRLAAVAGPFYGPTLWYHFLAGVRAARPSAELSPESEKH